jgi:hypothetical protein
LASYEASFFAFISNVSFCFLWANRRAGDDAPDLEADAEVRQEVRGQPGQAEDQAQAGAAPRALLIWPCFVVLLCGLIEECNVVVQAIEQGNMESARIYAQVHGRCCCLLDHIVVLN